AGEFDERPVRQVEVGRYFSISATEVTNSQFEQFDPSHKSLRGKHGFSKEDNQAVIFVSWQDAVRFCQWLSQKEGKAYRLPTEAEWEYACRAGTTTAYSTGDSLPKELHKNQKETWEPRPVSLRVAQGPSNPWGLYDMHGNVEEWCADWYGSYPDRAETDPLGPETGSFKITRGGSHGTELIYLRSANRSAALPDDRHEMIGFRVVQSDPPKVMISPQSVSTPLWAQNVSQQNAEWIPVAEPNFFGPIEYVRIPADSNGPLFSKHNHCPAITACPNGDLLAVWYTCNTEPGRELAIAASRLRKGKTEWDPASLFWDVPDRNDHGSEVAWDGDKTLYHFNGLSTDATWGKLALVLRTSQDNGASWSPAALIDPEHGLRNQVISGLIRTRDGRMILPCDAVTEGSGGTAIHISRDNGKTWTDPGKGKPTPKFAEGKSGAWIAGIHARLVELADGRLLAFGRGDTIKGQMPQSVSFDGGVTWSYSPSPFNPIGSGQRLVLMRLREGPLLFVSFTDPTSRLTNPLAGPVGISIRDAQGNLRKYFGLFAAVSTDDGKTWPVQKLITPGGPAKTLQGGAWTGSFTLDETHAEPKGYLAATQTPDGLIHLISSRLYYRFNLPWLITSSSSDSLSDP
ncbi:MAG: SUMF1/EgtB/PvdO family nonheme iron enzyme, partial [Phycisphaerae bacterium]|nr:SUMF1/EgtB/PvdO family nonheme iron enzyme [Phycisphaerae bacterium]